MFPFSGLSLLLRLLAISSIATRGAASSFSKEELKLKWGNDWSFSGISTFAHLPHVHCLTNPDQTFDIGVIGVPFDTAVSYRPGARFGPRAIRAGSARQIPKRGYNVRAALNPYAAGLHILDCGDVPVTPFDNVLALKQMSEAYAELGGRRTTNAKLKHPRLLALGGDHSIALPTLRALAAIYAQPITVLHFDAHLDTWDPRAYDAYWLEPDVPLEKQPSAFTHGSMFWLARREGLIANGSVHAGLRTRLSGVDDNLQDSTQGWTRIASDDVDASHLGVAGVAKKIMDVIGAEKPVYVSVDIDVIDPGLAPGTGTPEPGGWSTRELVMVLRGIEGLNIVGGDVVEVSPGYDGRGEQTALAGAQVVYELLTSMVKRSVDEGVVDAATSKSKDEL